MKSPRQRRSHATLARITAAAEHLFAERGIADVGLTEILQEARASVGSFYARFDSKEALVRFLSDRFWDRARAEWDRRLDPGTLAGQPLAVVIGAAVGFLVGTHRRHHATIRALVQYGLARPESGLLKRARELDGFIVGRITELAQLRIRDLRHPNPPLAIELGYLQLVGALRAVVLVGWPKTSLGALADETIVEELTRSFLAYLGGGDEKGEGRSEKGEGRREKGFSVAHVFRRAPSRVPDPNAYLSKKPSRRGSFGSIRNS